jgi:hypothetical protein
MGKAIDLLRNYWDSRISGLTLQALAERLYTETGGEEFVVDNPGTLMKLLFLWSYMRFPYLHIMGSQREKHRKNNRQAKLFYLDPYAGNGVVKVRIEKDNEIRVPGSAVLALLVPTLLHKERSKIMNYIWDVMVLNDVSDKHQQELIWRYTYIFNDLFTKEFILPLNYKIYSEAPSPPLSADYTVIISSYDCTQETTWVKFSQFLNAIKGQKGWLHGLVFLDPPSPAEMPLSFIPRLLSVPSDIITLLHTGIFAENVFKRIYKPKTLMNILNCDYKLAESLLQQTHTRDELEKLYLDRFCVLLNNTKLHVGRGSPIRDFIRPIRLRTKRGHYYLVIATRTTGGEKYIEWQNWLDKFAAEVEALNDVQPSVIDILLSKQATLN